MCRLQPGRNKRLQDSILQQRGAGQEHRAREDASVRRKKGAASAPAAAPAAAPSAAPLRPRRNSSMTQGTESAAAPGPASKRMRRDDQLAAAPTASEEPPPSDEATATRKPLSESTGAQELFGSFAESMREIISQSQSCARSSQSVTSSKSVGAMESPLCAAGV